jgi:hypothetical protein
MITAMTDATALCDGQIAIGSSMLLANDEIFTLSDSPPPLQST